MAEDNRYKRNQGNGVTNMNETSNIVKHRSKAIPNQKRYKRHSGGALFLIEQTVRNPMQNDLHKSKSTSSINDENGDTINKLMKSKSELNLNKNEAGIDDIKEDKTSLKVIKSAKITVEVHADPLRRMSGNNMDDILMNNASSSMGTTDVYASTPNSNDNHNPLHGSFSTIHKYSNRNQRVHDSQSSSPTSTVSEITMTSNSDFPQQTHVIDVKNIKIPIVGYEVMEERARFTVYKLRILTGALGETWLVLRRYTDFVRLYNRLKLEFPTVILPLPRKKWFGDNFKPKFLQDRVQGLQNFINSVLSYNFLVESLTVKEFFCLNEPPIYSECMEDSKALFEAQEETILQLRKEILNKDNKLRELQDRLADEIDRNHKLQAYIKNTQKNCTNCNEEINKIIKSDKNASGCDIKENSPCRTNRQVSNSN